MSSFGITIEMSDVMRIWKILDNNGVKSEVYACKTFFPGLISKKSSF